MTEAERDAYGRFEEYPYSVPARLLLCQLNRLSAIWRAKDPPERLVCNVRPISPSGMKICLSTVQALRILSDR